MRRFVLFLCAVLAACGRDLGVPPQQQPPQITDLQPRAGFAGDLVVLTGTSLNAPGLQIFFDVQPATIVTPAAQRDGRSLAVFVPASVLGASVSAVSPNGTGVFGGFSYLGIGHPQTLALRAQLPVGPQLASVLPLAGGQGFAAIDSRYGSVLGLSTAGAPLGPPAAAGKPALVFGSGTTAWVLDAALPALRHFDLPTGAEIAPDRVLLSAAPALAAASPSGAQFAWATATQILVRPLPGGVAVPFAVSAAVALRFVSETALVGLTATAPFRIDLPSGLSIGSALPANARPAAGAATAVRGASLAYATQEGNIAFLDFTAAGAPSPSGAVWTPPVAPSLLAWPGANLLVGDRKRATVVSLDATGKTVVSQALVGLSSLSAIADGPFVGLAVAAAGSNSVLLLADGTVLRADAVASGLGPFGVDPTCGHLLAATSFGPLLLIPPILDFLPLSVGIRLDGVESGPGGVVAWIGQDLYAYDPGASCSTFAPTLRKVATSPEHILFAALSENHRWVAATDGRVLELLPRSDLTAPGSPQRLDFGAPVARLPLAYARGSLLAASAAAGGGYVVTAFAPGTLTPTSTLALAGPPSALNYSSSLDLWLVLAQIKDAAGNLVAVESTAWRPGSGALGTSRIPAVLTAPSATSADGRLLVGISADPLGTNPGLDTFLLQLAVDRVVVTAGPHVTLPAAPLRILPSPDGARLYVSMPAGDAIAIVE